MLPLLYLHGLSSKDFGPALEGCLGTDAGLPATTIIGLTVQWRDEARHFAEGICPVWTAVRHPVDLVDRAAGAAGGDVPPREAPLRGRPCG